MSLARWLVWALSTTVVAQEPDAGTIVQRSLAKDLINFGLARNYTFTEDTCIRMVDGKGRITKTETETKEIFFLYGEPYERLVKKNGKALDEKTERKERGKLESLTRQRGRETPSRREQRLAKFEKERDEFRTFRQQIGKAYDWSVRGSERVGGRETWVLDATPKPGYKPINRQSSLLPKIKGSLWVSKDDYQWVKAEGESLDTISWGFFIARLAKGAKIAFESTKINEEIWLPRRFYAAFDGRIALLKSFRGNVEQTMSNYRKFQTESRIVAIGEK